MALTVKADAEDLPSIFSILGLGGPPPNDAQAPPVDSSLAGAPDAPQTTQEPAVQQKSVPTKLGRLQQIIQASQGNVDHPTMTDEHSSPDAPADPTEQMIAAAQGNNTFPASPPDQMPAAGTVQAPAPAVHKSWAQTHPTLLRILKGAATTAEGGAAGAGAMTFGEGFARAHELTDPIRKEMERATLAEKAATTAHTKAATEQMNTQVTLPNGLTVPFALAQKLYPTLTTEQGKNARNTENINSRESIAGDKNALALRSKGLKLDANGKQVPLSRDEMSETEQASLDLKQSQQEAAAARAAVDKAKNDPNSPAYKAAIGRLRVAERNADTAAGRLGIETKKYQADYFGTDAQGNALPGAQIDEATGRPIGPRMANANNPSADRTRRGDLAANAIHNLNNIEDVIHRRGDDLFGPIMGRITNVRDMVGSDDPDIAAVGTEIHNYALASNGAHGVRSQQAIERTEDEILKHFKRGTNGALGGITAAKDSLLDFVKDQQLGKRARPSTPVAPAKGGAQPQATHVYDPATQTIVPIKH